jgi:hypothetical protein|tara:strand:- start:2465 stop:3043 length:579 start_codon:yes stop_codon:yes gene_type:complete
MEQKIIGLLGTANSGKDTVGNYLISNHQFMRYAFGDPVKDICKTLFSLSNLQLSDPSMKEIVDERWGLRPRDMFQRIGTEFGQMGILKLFPELKNKIKYRELWVKLFEEWLKQQGNMNIVITDVRFKHEIECIKKYGGTIIKMNRNTSKNETYLSETEINLIPDDMIDHVIDNNHTLDDLYSQLDTFIYVPF